MPLTSLKGITVELALGLVLVALLGAATLIRGQPGPPEHLAETKDRLSPEAMAALVEAPVALLEDGDTAGADAAARRLVAVATARGDKVRVADILTAYAIALYSHGASGAAEDTPRPTLWMEEAVTATRGAWGARHPETAVVLHSLADMLRQTSPDAPPPEAERALREALAIRLATLGPSNAESLASMAALADLLTAGPAAASVVPGRYAEAAQLYRKAIAGFARLGRAVSAEAAIDARMGLAELDARAGKTAEALAVYEDAKRSLPRPAAGRAGDPGACLSFAARRQRLAALLRAHGGTPAATGLGERDMGGTLAACL